MITITPYEKNAKKHPKAQVLAIAKSIQRFGWQQPIKVGKDNVILVGHGRYQAWREHGSGMNLKEPWVVNEAGETISGGPETRKLTKAEEEAYRLADNKLNESDWDMDLAMETLRELDTELQELTGFDVDLLIEPEPEDDEVPEVPEEPRSKPGDLYELGPHRVLCGDSTKMEDVERLMDGKKADMVFTDPPYGVAYKPKATAGEGRSVSSARLKGCAKELIANDANLEQAYEIARQALALHQAAQAHFVCCDWKSYAMMQRAVEQAGIDQKACIVWDKGGPYQYMDKYSKGHEFIIYAGPYGGEKTVSTDIWSFPREFRPDHPTPKPVDLICNALSHFPLLTTVVDVFCGSGSTLIAAEKTGRICYGMELDPKYVDVIVQRYVDYTGHGKIKLNGKEIDW